MTKTEPSPVEEPAPDLVNSPPHYTQGRIECIDAIESALGLDGFIAFLQGQVLKYTWRLGRKGPAEVDARKAAWYQERLVAALQEREREGSREASLWRPPRL